MDSKSTLEQFFLEIKYETKVGRIMAYTLTQIRNKIVSHVNQQAAKIIEFKRAGLNNLVTYDVLQVFFIWMTSIIP